MIFSLQINDNAKSKQLSVNIIHYLRAKSNKNYLFKVFTFDFFFDKKNSCATTSFGTY